MPSRSYREISPIHGLIFFVLVGFFFVGIGVYLSAQLVTIARNGVLVEATVNTTGVLRGHSRGGGYRPFTEYSYEFAGREYIEKGETPAVFLFSPKGREGQLATVLLDPERPEHPMELSTPEDWANAWLGAVFFVLVGAVFVMLAGMGIVVQKKKEKTL